MSSTILKSTILISEHQLSKFPISHQKPILYSRFIRLKKFISKSNSQRCIFKDLIKRKFQNNDIQIPTLLNTLHFLTLAVCEDVEGDKDKQIAHSILSNLILFEIKKRKFLEIPRNKKYASVLYKREFDHLRFKPWERYYELVENFNKSLDLCL